jgi:two-component system cell cycle sensor histidine kinase/response regulator CckA
VVEDEPAILRMAQLVLKECGYTVLAAASPLEALEAARDHQGDIHLLVTDVVMPEMNGRQLARALMSLHPSVKSLFMSGYTGDIIAQNGILHESVNFIQKPFSMSTLAAKVREVLNAT